MVVTPLYYILSNIWININNINNSDLNKKGSKIQTCRGRRQICCKSDKLPFCKANTSIYRFKVPIITANISVNGG